MNYKIKDYGIGRPTVGINQPVFKNGCCDRVLQTCSDFLNLNASFPFASMLYEDINGVQHTIDLGGAITAGSLVDTVAAALAKYEVNVFVYPATDARDFYHVGQGKIISLTNTDGVVFNAVRTCTTVINCDYCQTVGDTPIGIEYNGNTELLANAPYPNAQDLFGDVVGALDTLGVPYIADSVSVTVDPAGDFLVKFRAITGLVVKIQNKAFLTNNCAEEFTL